MASKYTKAYRLCKGRLRHVSTSSHTRSGTLLMKPVLYSTPYMRRM
jgi:hypothetical protein